MSLRLPRPYRAVVQTARNGSYRSRRESSLPVLGAAAAQDEALGEKVYFIERSRARRNHEIIYPLRV